MMKWMVLILFSGIAVLGLAQQIKCKSPTRYLIPVFKANWFKAAEYCFSVGMQLAITNSKEDHDRIVEAVKSSPIYKNQDTVVYVGGNDLGEEGVFYWHSTGVRMAYAQWHPGQPDNWKGIEDCVALVDIPGWSWVLNDGSCESVHHFICENVESIHDIGVF